MSRMRKSLAAILLGLLLALGLFARLTDLTDLPLDFHPTRQLFSALKARGMYYAWFDPAISEPWKEFAIRKWRSLDTIEPPILETLTALTYGVFGERLWIARIYSSVFWVLGALAVHGLGKRIASEAGGLLAAAVYLFLPYGVIASRSFQPDPLMVALIAAFAWALLRWHDSPTRGRAVAAGLLGGLAILVKTVAVFFVGGAFAALTLTALGLRRLIRDRQAWLMLILILLPAAAYYVWGMLRPGGLASQFSGRFIPSLLVDPLFYLRWDANINTVVGNLLFALGLLGVFLVNDRPARALLAGWWIGYFVYSLIFNYHSSTHDYYQLPLLPLAALSVAPYALLIVRALEGTGARARWAKAALAALFLFAVLTTAYESRRTLRRVDYRPEAALWAGLGERFRADSAPGSDAPSVVALAPDYDGRATYWGGFTVTSWPYTAELAYRNLAGNQDAGFAARFAALAAGKRYFLITDFAEFDRQPELRDYLSAHYPTAAQTDEYLIFDLQPEIR